MVELLVIGGLLYISVIALGGPAWMGVLFGLVEVGVALRVTPPPAAHVMRWITGSIGVVTVVWAIVWGLVSEFGFHAVPWNGCSCRRQDGIARALLSLSLGGQGR